VDDTDQGSRAARGVDETEDRVAHCRTERPSGQSLATAPTERYSAPHRRLADMYQKGRAGVEASYLGPSG
jgi:hypothetical protein